MVRHLIASLEAACKSPSTFFSTLAVVGPPAFTEICRIFCVDRIAFRKERISFRKFFSKVMDKHGIKLYFTVGSVWHSVLTKRRTEVIVLYAHIVEGTCRNVLFKSREFSFRILSTMIHVVAKKIASACHLCKTHSAYVLRLGNRTTLQGDLKSATKFRSEVWIFRHVKSNSLTDSKIAADGVIVSFMCEDIVSAWFDLCNARIPWSFTITAHDRKHSGSNRSTPACRRIKRCVKTYFTCHFFKTLHVLFTFRTAKAAAVSVFILNLNTDNWTTIFYKKTFHLLVNCPVPFFNFRKIFLIVC